MLSESISLSLSLCEDLTLVTPDRYMSNHMWPAPMTSPSILREEWQRPAIPQKTAKWHQQWDFWFQVSFKHSIYVNDNWNFPSPSNIPVHTRCWKQRQDTKVMPKGKNASSRSRFRPSGSPWEGFRRLVVCRNAPKRFNYNGFYTWYVVYHGSMYIYVYIQLYTYIYMYYKMIVCWVSNQNPPLLEAYLTWRHWILDDSWIPLQFFTKESLMPWPESCESPLSWCSLVADSNSTIPGFLNGD